MNNRKVKKLSILGLLILAGGVLMTSFHYHEGGEILDDCPVCRFQDAGVAASSVDISTATLPAVTVNQNIVCEPETAFTPSTRPFETLPNAPPSLS
jgi:hypothetical protein